MARQRVPPWTPCAAQGCIGIRISNETMCFAHVSSKARETFLDGLTAELSLDLRGVPLGGDQLAAVLNAVRTKDGIATLGDVRFNETQFGDDASFRGVQFSGDAWFERARFGKYVKFDGAQFNRVASFRWAQFSGDASFFEAKFGGPAWFGGAQFGRRAAFANARFQQTATLGPLAARQLVLDGASFEKGILVEAVSLQVSCVAARFAEAATFRLRYPELILDGAIFSQPSTIAFAEKEFKQHGQPENSGTVAHSLFSEDAAAACGLYPRPRLLSIREADVGTLTLSDLDLSVCLVAGAHRLDQLRIEGVRPFSTTPPVSTTPPAWRLHLGSTDIPIWRRWTRRQTLAEEHHCRAGKTIPTVSEIGERLARPVWYPPSCQPPAWLTEMTGRQAEKLTPARLAILYRALRKALEDAKDQPGAADFYYGEMEMRRQATPRFGVERAVLTLYWLVAGYALRAWRAVAASAALLILAAWLLVYRHGFADPNAMTYWSSLRYCGRTAIGLLPKDLPVLTPWGDVLQIAVRITIPVLLALAVLSVRGRIKR
jgi:hypothetical protein